jgi:hypothetical protein
MVDGSVPLFQTPQQSCLSLKYCCPNDDTAMTPTLSLILVSSLSITSGTLALVIKGLHNLALMVAMLFQGTFKLNTLESEEDWLNSLHTHHLPSLYWMEEHLSALEEV